MDGAVALSRDYVQLRLDNARQLIGARGDPRPVWYRGTLCFGGGKVVAEFAVGFVYLIGDGILAQLDEGPLDPRGWAEGQSRIRGRPRRRQAAG